MVSGRLPNSEHLRYKCYNNFNDLCKHMVIWVSRDVCIHASFKSRAICATGLGCFKSPWLKLDRYFNFSCTKKSLIVNTCGVRDQSTSTVFFLSLQVSFLHFLTILIIFFVRGFLQLPQPVLSYLPATVWSELPWWVLCLLSGRRVWATIVFFSISLSTFL